MKDYNVLSSLLIWEYSFDHVIWIDWPSILLLPVYKHLNTNFVIHAQSKYNQQWITEISLYEGGRRPIHDTKDQGNR